MTPLRTIALTTFVGLALCFATFPANAANRVVNGDFETCDLTGWKFLPSDRANANDPFLSTPLGNTYTLPPSGVYNTIGIDGCSWVVFDQSTIYQEFEIALGEAFTVTFDANLIPGWYEITEELRGLIHEPDCADESEPYVNDDPESGLVEGMAGTVTIEFLHAEPGNRTNQTLSGVSYAVNMSGTHTFNTPAAPTTSNPLYRVDATHARIKVAGCAAFGGVIFDNIVVDTAA